MKVMDGLNRFRFENDAELMAAWKSASNVLGGPRISGGRARPDGASPTGGEVQPAA